MESMSYDWVHKNLYVVTHHRIDMLHLESRDGAVYFKNIAKCSAEHHYHGAVVDPRKERKSVENYFFSLFASLASIFSSSTL